MYDGIIYAFNSMRLKRAFKTDALLKRFIRVKRLDEYIDLAGNGATIFQWGGGGGVTSDLKWGLLKRLFS